MYKDIKYFALLEPMCIENKLIYVYGVLLKQDCKKNTYALEQQ